MARCHPTEPLQRLSDLGTLLAHFSVKESSSSFEKTLMRHECHFIDVVVVYLNLAVNKVGAKRGKKFCFAYPTSTLIHPKVGISISFCG